ncbi:MAG: DNA topoisomerase VI subunit B [Myxococcaceae bacterium]|nr:DNA topoisomerase VI subunit B [Myxococcaceae bacterium]
MSSSNNIREISISEFFSKNRHLLGFDSPIKALLTAVREGVDNSLDACEEAGIMPSITVQIDSESETQFAVTISDNGPGISKVHLGNIFAKLLYGSKFHRLRQSRGQQGIGISAAVMYGQMTTGKPALVISKTSAQAVVHEIELQIDTKKNVPKILKERENKTLEWQEKESGTMIRIHMEGAYKEGRHGVLAYLSQTALSNPHASFLFIDPKHARHPFPRLMHALPKAPEEIKRHPHGVEIGLLMQLLQDAKKESVVGFLRKEFSRVSENVATDIVKRAGLSLSRNTQGIHRAEAESLVKSIQATKLLPPPTNCLSPLGEDSLIKALYWLFVESKKWDSEEQVALIAPEQRLEKKGQSEFAFDWPKIEPWAQNIETNEDNSLSSKEDNYFVTAVTRPPNVYRGNPFQVEVGLFYGKGLKDGLMQVYRYANRVPLQYQASACAMTKAAMSAPWKSYGLDQSKGALPSGPVVLVMHAASVWVPYTSESKEAIAHYDEILKEFRLAILECGRRLQRYLRHQKRQADEMKKRSYIEKYLNPISEALSDILGLQTLEKQEIVLNLTHILEKNYGEKKPK